MVGEWDISLIVFTILRSHGILIDVYLFSPEVTLSEKEKSEFFQ